jgi:DNA-binding NarL/FixJ family response regulator
MKKIRITLVCAGKEDYPGCADVLATFHEFEIIARHHSLTTAGIWRDLSNSDVVLLDESAVIQDGSDSVRAVHESFPFARILLIIEKSSKNKTIEALSMGITGVMERVNMVASIRKAIPVLYSGETWVSRGLVGSLHSQLKYAGDDSLFPHAAVRPPDIKN